MHLTCLVFRSHIAGDRAAQLGESFLSRQQWATAWAGDGHNAGSRAEFLRLSKKYADLRHAYPFAYGVPACARFQTNNKDRGLLGPKVCSALFEFPVPLCHHSSHASTPWKQASTVQRECAVSSTFTRVYWRVRRGQAPQNLHRVFVAHRSSGKRLCEVWTGRTMCACPVAAHSGRC